MKTKQLYLFLLLTFLLTGKGVAQQDIPSPQENEHSEIVPQDHETDHLFFENTLLISLSTLILLVPILAYHKIKKIENEKTALRQTCRTLSTALESAGVIPWEWNLEQKTLRFYVPILLSEGTSQEYTHSVTEEACLSLIHKEDREKVWQSCQELIYGKRTELKEEFRALGYHNSFSRFEWMQICATVEKRNEQGKPLLLAGSSLHITEYKDKEESLLSSCRKAEESNRMKSAFLANISHELRNPINAIVGFSALLASAEDEKEKEEYLDIIENNNAVLLQLISDVLDLSKIEAGTLEFSYTDIDLNLLLKYIESSCQLKVQEKGIKVVFTDSIPDCRILTEKNRVSQILTNLLTNAIKFTEKGCITFGYRITPDHFIRFHVTDTGCGIPQEQQKTIFSRFVKLDPLKPGTGLGLSICQTLTQTMGGKIGVDSEEGKGATFWFTIPYKPSELYVTS